MSDFKLFLGKAKDLFRLAAKAEGIREIEQADAMAHVQLELAKDAARAEEAKKNPQQKRWWGSQYK